MAQRKKNSRSKKAKVQSQEDRVRAAADHLQRGRFRDAAADYKQLLKQEHRAEWVSCLAQAYAGRAEHLASRGMIKEAIALWHNRAEVCGEPLADPCYLQWLVAADRSKEIARVYSQDPAALAGAGGISNLRARLAAAALADGGELIGQLPTDDPVVRDYAAAEDALVAYAKGDDTALETALKRIAFRSPYRDFCQLLKALQRREQNPATAAELWGRIPVDTPFAGIRTALEVVAQLESRPRPDTMAGLTHEITALVAVLAGWSSSQQRLVTPLAQLGPAPTQQALFEFVISYRATLGKTYARDAAFVLASTDNQLQPRFLKTYDTLSEAEKTRLIALGLETRGAMGDAVDYWQALLDARTAEPAQDADEPLRQALIHRHIADLIQPRLASLPLVPEVVDHLASSLELNPEDRDSTLRLLDHYLHVRDLKAARRWVDRALAQFPDDAGCLFKAAETATASGAYKKAAGFAERILAIDPINAGGRGLLVDAHLGHARKQIKAAKPAAARRELEHASAYARGVPDTGRVAILHGLTTLAVDGAKAAGPALNTSIERAGGGLTGRFLLLLEAGCAGQNLNSVTRAAGLTAVKPLGDRDQVLALIRVLGSLRDGQQYMPAVEAALTKLAPALNQAAQFKLDRGSAEQVCETLLRYRQYSAIKRYARTALKHWPQDPLFIFYRTLGRLEGRLPEPWDSELRHLEPAYDRAQSAGDTRTAERIGAYLDSAFPGLPDFDSFDPFADDMQAPELDETVHALIDGELNPAFRAVFEHFLEPADVARIEAAVKGNEPIPADIQSRLQALTGGGSLDAPPPRQKPRRSKPVNPYQSDMFGDNE